MPDPKVTHAPVSLCPKGEQMNADDFGKLVGFILFTGGVWNKFGLDVGMIALGACLLLDIWSVGRTNALAIKHK